MAERTWKPGVASLLFLLAALAAFHGARQGLLDDPGLGWHIRNIDAMIQQGGWLTLDPFTDQTPPTRWYTNQWLGEVPYWIGWKLFGEEGIAAVNALLIGLLAHMLYRIFTTDGAPWPVALSWTFLTLAATSVSWTARPNVYTILFVLITARVLERYHSLAWEAERTLCLVPLFAVWANTHGGFLAGFILLALAWLVEAGVMLLSLDQLKRKAAREGLGHLSVLGVWCFIATLFNPYGANLYPWIFRLLGDTYFMNLNLEWKAVDFRSGGAMRYELLLLSLIVLLVISDRRPSLLEGAFVVVWLHLALTGFRYVALWVVVVAPLLVRQSLEIDYLRKLAREKELSTEKGSLYHTQLGYGHWAWNVVFAGVILALAAVTQGRHVRHNQEIVATETIDRLIAYGRRWSELNDRPPRIFHAYDWGGYLTWRGWPDMKNWIDDRNEVQGKDRCERCFATMRAEPGWEDELAKIDLVCIYSDSKLAERLHLSREWEQVGPANPFAVIFARRSAKLPEAQP